MEWNAKWIWDSGEPCPKNAWLCLRKTVTPPNGCERAVLKATADSRYYLYINGALLDFGPIRSWPWKLAYDSHDITHLLHPGQNVIAVLVNHYGTSTTQYVQGRGGFLAQLDFEGGSAPISRIHTDQSWKVRRHESFNRNTGRINVAFPWIEEYDARKFAGDWMTPEYDDRTWENAREIGPVGMEPWRELTARDVPPFAAETIYPVEVAALRCVKPRGQHICLDFGPNFYPDCCDSKDKKQLGYAVSLLHAPQRMTGLIKHLAKKWPEVPEKIRLNGREYVYRAGETVREVQLEKGANLLIVDISGGYQRFELSLFFDFERDIDFRIPWDGTDYPFLTIGPFDWKPVHNIAAMEGVVLNESMPEYLAAWQLEDISGLNRFLPWLKPVLTGNISTDNIAVLAREKRIIRDADPHPALQNMVKANPEYAVILPEADGDPELIIDFGEETSAFIELETECAAGTVFDFNMFEYRSADGHIEETDGLNNTFRYIGRNGRQTYRSFIKRGFRYIMLTLRALRQPVKIYAVRAHRCGYPAVATGSFACSDFELNQIWEISRRTVRLCMEDTFVDCPAYEQSFWIGDSRTSSLISHYLFGSYDLVKHCLLLAAGSLTRSDLPEAQVPTGCDTILTAWSLLWLITCRDYFEYTGDREFLTEIYPALVKTIDGFGKYLNDDWLLDINAWNLLDWAGMDTPCDRIVTHQNALLVKALRDTARIARVLANHDDGRRFDALAGHIGAAVNRYLWDERKQAYIDSIHHDGCPSDVVSMQTNLMVYWCGCATQERRTALEKLMHDPPQSFIQIGSPFGSFLLYEALLHEGRTSARADAVPLIVADIRRRWGEMLAYGATTCWETFLGFYKYTLTRSHCHAWSAAPAYFCGAYLLGVRPLEPGFAKILIEPQLSGLSWIKGTVPTPFGPVTVHCREARAGEYLDILVQIPSACAARVVFPVRAGQKVRFNGVVVDQTAIDIASR